MTKTHTFRLEDTIYYEATVIAETREQAEALLWQEMENDDLNMYEVDNSGLTLTKD